MVAANVSVAVFISLTAFSVADNAVAQSPGYRLRMPGGSSVGGKIGASARPPRLSVPSDRARRILRRRLTRLGWSRNRPLTYIPSTTAYRR